MQRRLVLFAFCISICDSTISSSLSFTKETSDNYGSENGDGIEIETKDVGKTIYDGLNIKTYKDRAFNSDGCNSDNENDFGDEKTTLKSIYAMFTKLRLTTPKPIVLPKGWFFNFLVNICDTLLQRFSTSKIRRYFDALSDGLRGLGNGYLQKLLIRKFRRKLTNYANYKSKTKLTAKIQHFLTAITSGRPRANNYIIAMNSIFKDRRVLKLEEYVYRLKRYGDDLSSLKRIRRRTRAVFKDVIFKSFYELNEKTQREISNKFQKALLEYSEKK